MAFSTIQTSTDNAVLTVRLNRPDRLNAFNADVATELLEVLRSAQRDEAVRCLVLTGNGRAFCSGQDLHALRRGSSGGGEPLELGAYLRELLNPLIVRMRSLDKPIIGAVNGVAAGFGVSLALATDVRICARSAAFRMAFINIGLVPDGGATLALLQQIGYARATAM